MARNFIDVYKKILAACPNTILAQKLESGSPFWAPEVTWFNLSRYVNNYMMPDSNNPVSVKVYAILCDLSEDDMIKKFKENGH